MLPPHQFTQDRQCITPEQKKRRAEAFVDRGWLGQAVFYRERSARAEGCFAQCVARFVAASAGVEQVGHLEFSRRPLAMRQCFKRLPGFVY
jgi:hypothetical protein